VYEELGVKVGLEIHQQLDAGRKLFCHCPTELRIDEPEYEVRRKLHPSFSEKGKIDQAALAEVKKGLTFVYQGYDSTCLVELDEEPPHPISEEAVHVGIQVALLLQARVVDEVHTMRKIVIDGSNTSGFQRTLLLATGGILVMDGKEYSIPTICLEEDAARIIETRGEEKVYRLDRLGIPLVEIATGPDITSPMEARQVAEALGQILRATGKVKRGLGTIREDLNVSIVDGARCEIKGVQMLDLIATYVEREVERQAALVDIARDLSRRNARVIHTVVDVSSCFQKTKAKIIKNSLNKGEKVCGLLLKGFSGLVRKEIQPGRRLGTELADRARVVGVGGIFHSDELPAYGISGEEVHSVKEMLAAGEGDAFVLVADGEDKCRAALHEVAVRAEEALDGVPEETREPLPDGNTRYARPLPGAERMYPETDIPSLVITEEQIHTISHSLPELPHSKLQRFMKEYNLTDSYAKKILNSGYEDIFEETQKFGLKSSLFIKAIDTLKNLEHAHKYIADESQLILCFKKVARGEIVKEAMDDILPQLADGNLLEDLDLTTVSSSHVETVVKNVVQKNIQVIKEKGMRAVAPLMGTCMKELRGKADGKLINDLLTQEIKKVLETSM
jgi:glutamyl-tRNA(Gln) amidotransferase subunit E